MTDRRILDQITVASPCSADWNQMQGDDRSRYCGQCRLHVHDLSAMTTDEALALLRSASDRVCARFHRRSDGRVLTRDCPVGLRQRLRRAWTRAAAMLVALWSFGCRGASEPAPGPGDPVMGDVVAPDERRPLQGEAALPDGDQEPLMGKIMVPQPEPIVPPAGGRDR